MPKSVKGISRRNVRDWSFPAPIKSMPWLQIPSGKNVWHYLDSKSSVLPFIIHSACQSCFHFPRSAKRSDKLPPIQEPVCLACLEVWSKNEQEKLITQRQRSITREQDSINSLEIAEGPWHEFVETETTIVKYGRTMSGYFVPHPDPITARANAVVARRRRLSRVIKDFEHERVEHWAKLKRILRKYLLYSDSEVIENAVRDGVVRPGTVVTLYDYEFEETEDIYLDAVETLLDGHQVLVNPKLSAPNGVERVTTATPVGEAILGRRVGEDVEYAVNKKVLRCRIACISVPLATAPSPHLLSDKTLVRDGRYDGRGRDAASPNDSIIDSDASQDGARYVGWMARDSSTGWWGSPTNEDDYSDEADA